MSAPLVVAVRLIRNVNPISGITSRTRTEEVRDAPTKGDGVAMKTLAIRLEEPLHAQLTAVAQIEGITITDAIRQAIEAYVGRLKDSDQLNTKAQAMLDEIEREAEARRAAISSLFSTDQAKAAPSTTRSSRRGRPQGKPE